MADPGGAGCGCILRGRISSVQIPQKCMNEQFFVASLLLLFVLMFVLSHYLYSYSQNHDSYVETDVYFFSQSA